MNDATAVRPLLKRLEQHGIYVFLSGPDRLKVNAGIDGIAPEDLSELQDRKADIIAWLRDAKRQTDSAGLPVEDMANGFELPLQVLAERPASTPASHAQRMFWFLHHMPGNEKSSLTLVNAVYLIGELDVDALRLCIQHVVNQHDCLRARFSLRNRVEVSMHVDALVELLLDEIDCRHLSADEAEARVQQEIAQARAFEFDLVNGPLFRACVVRCTGDRDALILSMHHIVADAWAQGLVRGAISHVYSTYKTTGRLPESPQTIHYRDFAYWSTHWHQNGLLATQLEFWRQQFDRVKGLPRFPTDFDNPLNTLGETGHIDLALLPAQIERIAATGERLGLSVYVLLLAAFKLALYERSRSPRQVVSSFHLGRARAGLDRSIGQYADGFFIITDIDERMGLIDFCAVVRTAVHDARNHCDISGVYVRQRVGGNAPVIPVVFNYFDMFAASRWDLAGTRAEVISKPLLATTTMVAMELDVRWTETGLRSVLTYNRKLFAAATMECVSATFTRLIDAMGAEDNTDIAIALGLDSGRTQRPALEAV